MPSNPFVHPSESEPKLDSPQSPNLPISPDIPARHEQIEQILDEQVTFTRRGSYQRFLVKWQGRPDTDATWIPRSELQQLAPDLLAEFDHLQQMQQQESDSTEPSFYHPGRIDEGISSTSSQACSRRGRRHQLSWSPEDTSYPVLLGFCITEDVSVILQSSIIFILYFFGHDVSPFILGQDPAWF